MKTLKKILYGIGMFFQYLLMFILMIVFLPLSLILGIYSSIAIYIAKKKYEREQKKFQMCPDFIEIDEDCI